MEFQLTYTALAAALDALGSPEDASEYHGTLCGVLCVQDAAELDPVDLVEAELEDYRPDIAAEGQLKQLVQATREALLSSDMVFSPLLPGDELPLGSRVQALALWCQGFLYGLSSRKRIELANCSEELREIVHDLAQFTQAGLESDDNEDLEESAYTELVEYIRVGAQLIFLELNPTTHRNDDSSGKPTLH